MTFADKVLEFNASLSLANVKLPEGIRVMNPFRDGNSKLIQRVTTEFYTKYYNDNRPRKIILGINPGRLGAGATGVPFSDTKRLKSECGIEIPEFSTHEPSSAFVYKVIHAYGGARKFYSEFYIGSLCPLGFVVKKEDEKEVNYNYYDNKKLQDLVTPFIVSSVINQIAFGIDIEKCICLGTGKNYKFMKTLNDRHGFFNKIVPVEHPRYVMQYKSKYLDEYVKKYLEAI